MNYNKYIWGSKTKFMFNNSKLKQCAVKDFRNNLVVSLFYRIALWVAKVWKGLNYGHSSELWFWTKNWRFAFQKNCEIFLFFSKEKRCGRTFQNLLWNVPQDASYCNMCLYYSLSKSCFVSVHSCTSLSVHKFWREESLSKIVLMLA